MSILPITVYGDQILREIAKPVENIDGEVIEKIQDMFLTMRNASGIGLAANQVGWDKQVFVIDLSVMEEYSDQKPVVMINPKIVESSDELVIYEEGCLSLPFVRADVERPESILIKYLDTDEKEIELEVDDWFARVIQHEYDHLLGKMIPDRVEPHIKKSLQKDLLRIMKRQIDPDYLITEK